MSRFIERVGSTLYDFFAPRVRVRVRARDWISMCAYINPRTRLIEFPHTLRLSSGELIENPLVNLVDSSRGALKVELPWGVRGKIDLGARLNLKTGHIKYRKFVLIGKGTYINNPLRDVLRRSHVENS
jgi:hypothetical protein